MKPWIFKTLNGTHITIFFKGNSYMKINVANRKTIAEFKTRKELEKNPSIEIGDTTISVGFKKLLGIWSYPQVIEDGTLLYGSTNGAGPEYAINEAFTVGLVIAILNILFGLICFTPLGLELFDTETGIISIVSGCIFLGLSIGIKKKSLQALNIYIVILVILFFLFVLLSLSAGQIPLIAIGLRLIFIFAMIRAIPGMQIVQSQKKRSESSDILDSDLMA